MGIRCADHVTPLYPQKLTLTSPTGGGHSVGIVRSRTKATELFTICATLHIAQIVNTEDLQHYIPWKHGLFQVYNCKYPA